MSATQHEAALDSDHSITVVLASLAVCSVGLSLVANPIHVLRCGCACRSVSWSRAQRMVLVVTLNQMGMVQCGSIQLDVSKHDAYDLNPQLISATSFTDTAVIAALEKVLG
jgi:hypothetical protein